MAARKVKGKAILIGYDRKGKCVYSDILELSDYYDGEHVWDRSSSVKKLGLVKLRGFLFDSKGGLDQEFENTFDLRTGTMKARHVRHADGTVYDHL
jgi:hypothetical protein